MAGLSMNNDGLVNPTASTINNLGNTLNNAAWVLMSKMKSPEELEALRQQAALRQAETGFYQAKVDQLNNQQREAQSARDVFVQNVSGATAPQLSAQRTLMKGGTVETPPVDLPAGQEGPPRPGAITDILSDAVAQKIRNAEAAWAARGNGNADTTMKAVGDAAGNDLVYAQNGDVTKVAGARYANAGHAPFNFQSNGTVGNNLTGALDETGGMARASIDDKKAAAESHRGSAAASFALAKSRNTETQYLADHGFKPETGTPSAEGGTLTTQQAAKIAQYNESIKAARSVIGNMSADDIREKPEFIKQAELAMKPLVDVKTGQPTEDKEVSGYVTRFQGTPKEKIPEIAGIASDMIRAFDKNAPMFGRKVDDEKRAIKAKIEEAGGGGLSQSQVSQIYTSAVKDAKTPKQAAPQQQQPAQQSSVPPAAQRVIGKAYDTPRGQMIWQGNGWSPANG